MIQQLWDEYRELDDRTDRLNAYVNSEEFKTLDPMDQALLKMQNNAMHGYRYALRVRIERLEGAG
jgi:hypothetical protein